MALALAVVSRWCWEKARKGKASQEQRRVVEGAFNVCGGQVLSLITQARVWEGRRARRLEGVRSRGAPPRAPPALAPLRMGVGVAAW